MVLIRRVKGASMLPALKHGSIVVAISGIKARVGDIVVAKLNNRSVIKRLERIDNDSCYLVGDNRQESSDSRHYGRVPSSAILGVMKISLPAAEPSPHTRHRFAPVLGMIAAAVLAMFAVVHLFRIDTFLPILDEALPGSIQAVALTGVLIVIAEVFAVSVMLRMRLSPLARLTGILLAVIVPLTWLLITIWTLGSDVSSAQFGEFKETPSSIIWIVLNSLWLGFNVAALWILGYGSAPRLRKKT